MRSAILKLIGKDITSQVSGSCVVFAPHPDDEVLACGGTIARKRRQGIDVHIVYMTNGGYSYTPLPIATDELADIRGREARRAAEALGVEADCLEFLDCKNESLGEFVSNAVSPVQAILERVKPQEVYIPYRREFNREHIATHRAVAEAQRRARLLVQTYEYPIWSWPTKDWNRSGRWSISEMASALVTLSHLFDAIRLVKVDIADTLDIKRRALSEYRTQITPFRGPLWPMLPSHFVNRFLEPFEIFFETQHKVSFQSVASSGSP